MNGKGKGKWMWLPGTVVLVTGLILSWAAGVSAQDVGSDSDVENRTIKVALNKSRILELPVAVDTVSVGNPGVADVRVMHARQLQVLGKSLGTTNVVVWDRKEYVRAIVNVQVTHDLENLKASLYEMLPREPIEVRSEQKAIVLSGTVSSAARMDAALQLANSYVGKQDGGKVINMMEAGGAQQVMLDVKVAEVQRNVVKRLGVQFDAFDSGGELVVGAVQGGASFPDGVIEDFITSPSIDNIGVFGSYQSGDFLFNLVLEALHQEGVAKILAEPNLTTQSGQGANFLAGGEFPVPVPQGDGQTTIEFKEFGVALQFLPVVLSSDAINLKVDVSVSELGGEAAVAIGLGEEVARDVSIPSLTKRSASSTVELGSGETIAIAGMIDETLRENVDKFPGLGDVPIIGKLFRSEEFRKEQTEVVIFVTPRLSRPIDSEQARVPTGSFVAPGDLEFYLLGRLRSNGENGGDGDRARGDAALGPRAGGTAGRFGHGM